MPRKNSKREPERALQLQNGEEEDIKKLLTLLLFAAGLSRLGAEEPIFIDSYYPGDKLMWEHVTSAGPKAEIPGAPLGVILPHHAITAEYTGNFYQGLAKKIHPKTIILIGPNHFETGLGNIQTGNNLVYRTVFGNLDLEKSFMGKLTDSKIVSLDNDTFKKEHAVYFHAPFIKKFFPDAKLVPLIIKAETPRKELEDLVCLLQRNLPPDSLILASVDFSHYNYRETTEYHDLASYASIMNFDFEGIFNAEIDSPPSIFVLEKIMEFKGYKNAVRIYHTNTETFTGQRDSQNTSHQYFVFLPGENKIRQSLTILCSGKISWPHKSMELRYSWPWDRKYDPAKDPGPGKFLSKIRGEEDRFFMGYDLYLFDPSMQPARTEFRKNGLTVKILNVSWDKVSADSMEPEKNDETQIVIIHMIPDIPFKRIEARARSIITAGAAIVLFQGLDIPVKIETYKKGLVIYSLGDFISDKPESSGGLAQIHIEPGKILYREFPINSKNGFPELTQY